MKPCGQSQGRDFFAQPPHHVFGRGYPGGDDLGRKGFGNHAVSDFNQLLEQLHFLFGAGFDPGNGQIFGRDQAVAILLG